ncbi:MAG: hypothetical protein K5696_04390, partial [Lachnospiraceae bacterium]|nr:hypothetical protein [Lachnospiraceae bacterium]
AGLCARHREYLENPEALDMLAEMFKTKKHMRFFFNTDSGKYKDARRALDDFIAERDAMQEYINSHMDDPDFQQGLQQRANALAQKEEALSNRMVAYIGKVTKGNANEAGTKGIANMTQSAGAARLTGAKAILDAINENGQKFKDRMVNQARGEQYVAAQDAERVRETSFNSLFREKYDNIKQAGESGAHRRAAKEALTKIKAQKAAEDAAAAAQQAGQQMAGDVNGRHGGPVNRQ